MVHNYKKYLQECEKEKRKFLKKLTIKQSVAILEDLLMSQLLSKFKFTNDDHPIALYKQIELQGK
jgi:hypothetical protein